MVSTLLTPGCDECYGCDTPPPPQYCICPAPSYNQNQNMFVRINIPFNSGSGCCADKYLLRPFDTEYTLEPLTEACGFFAYSVSGLSRLICFVDTDGNSWRFIGRSVQIAAIRPIQQGVVSELVPVASIWLGIFDIFTNGTTEASIRYWYDFGTCDCIDDVTIDPGSFSVEKVGWPADTPSVCHTDNWSSVEVIQLGDCGDTCGNGCCDSLEATGITAVNKFNIGIAADSCRLFAELGLKTLTKTSPCTYVWIKGASSGACFNDSIGEDWEHIGDTFVVSSVNTSSNPPCTTAYLRMLFARISDSAGAYLQWNYAYDYCEYTAGTLALLSTENSFPNGAPPFPSASVVAV